MKTLKTFEIVMFAIAGLGILVFWIAGMKDCTQVATWSIASAGTAAWLGLMAHAVYSRRAKNGVC